MTNQDDEREQRRAAIERRAYEIYQARGGEHGLDREDWLQAERELGGGYESGGPAQTLDVGPNVPVGGGELGERSADVMPDVTPEETEGKENAT